MHLVAPPALYPAKCGQAQTVLWGKNTPLLSYSFDKYQGNANAEKRQSEAGHNNSLTSEEAKLLGSRTLLGALGLTTRSKDATRNKCHATRNKCLTGSNNKNLIRILITTEMCPSISIGDQQHCRGDLATLEVAIAVQVHTPLLLALGL